ncbi:hypothetical protein B0H17DRAFT_1123880 [Mycena rosella]|uniref:Uncharacterized protein n=1 Tax=Mycena rosella TaxID=1033263 RepID=A0AAD7H3T1_MYCRO|nr:hypothetical protein B0H17DRAFT_1123880 [Mycena rosella]
MVSARRKLICSSAAARLPLSCSGNDLLPEQIPNLVTITFINITNIFLTRYTTINLLLTKLDIYEDSEELEVRDDARGHVELGEAHEEDLDEEIVGEVRRYDEEGRGEERGPPALWQRQCAAAPSFRQRHEIEGGWAACDEHDEWGELARVSEAAAGPRPASGKEHALEEEEEESGSLLARRLVQLGRLTAWTRSRRAPAALRGGSKRVGKGAHAHAFLGAGGALGAARKRAEVRGLVTKFDKVQQFFDKRQELLHAQKGKTAVCLGKYPLRVFLLSWTPAWTGSRAGASPATATAIGFALGPRECCIKQISSVFAQKVADEGALGLKMSYMGVIPYVAGITLSVTRGEYRGNWDRDASSAYGGLRYRVCGSVLKYEYWFPEGSSAEKGTPSSDTELVGDDEGVAQSIESKEAAGDTIGLRAKNCGDGANSGGRPWAGRRRDIHPIEGEGMSRDSADNASRKEKWRA